MHKRKKGGLKTHLPRLATRALQLALLAVNGLAQNVNIFFLAVPVYTLVGLQPSIPHFLVFLAALSSLVWVGAAVGIAVGAFATSFQVAWAVSHRVRVCVRAPSCSSWPCLRSYLSDGRQSCGA